MAKGPESKKNSLLIVEQNTKETPSLLGGLGLNSHEHLIKDVTQSKVKVAFLHRRKILYKLAQSSLLARSQFSMSPFAHGHAEI